MAEFFPPAIFEVKAKVGEAIASFQEFNHELAKVDKTALAAGGSISKLEKSARFARATMLGLTGAFGVLAVASLKTLDTFDAAQTNLEVAVKNTGVSFTAAKPIIDAHADAMKNLGFSYTDTYDALSKMTAASGSPKMALESLSAAADLARFKNISLAEAGTILARASIGQAKGMGDLGIAINKTIPKGATLAQIIKAVEDRTKGSAVAFKNTLGGSLAVARANFQALEIQIGTALLPTAIQLTDWISKTAIPKFKEFVDFVKNHIGLFQTLGAAIAVIWAVPKIGAIITAIKALISAYALLRDSALIAAAAEAFATGGINLATGTAAVAALYGAFKLKNILDNKSTAAPSKSDAYLPSLGGTKTYQNTVMSAAPSISNLQGKGVQRYDPTKTPKTNYKKLERGNVTINQQINIDNTKHTMNSIKTGSTKVK